MVLSPQDRDKLSQLDRVQNDVRHAYALVEQFAASPRDAEQLAGNLRRAFNKLKMLLTSAGFDRVAQIAANLEVTARRGLSHGPKSRALREGMGNLTRQIELERKAVMAQAQRNTEQPQ